MIWETLAENFEFICCMDTEFKGQQDEGQINDPICVVIRELKSGKLHKHTGPGFKLPYPANKTLWIAHNVIAESHTLLSYGIKLPRFWWDTLIEDKKLYFGKVKSHSLLAACKRYGIPTISEDLKKYFIEKIILANETYNQVQLNKIVEYCESDVEAGSALFFRQLADIEKTRCDEGPNMIISQALFSGAAVACTAKVEFNGIPVNNKLLERIDGSFPLLKNKIIDELNKNIDVFDNYVFKQDKFEKLIHRLNLADRWPTTATGKFKTDEKTIFRFAQQYKEINDFYLASEFINSKKLKGFILGDDARARCSYRMYALKTGRTNPSTAKHPFNAPKCMRNLVKAADDKVLVNFDYKNQEVMIAACLSNDPTMIAACQSRDPYIYVARLNKAVPANATKDTHPKERDLYKTTTLAALYGQGATNMSKRMNLNIDYGQELFVKIKNTFPTYFAWAKTMFDKAMVQGFAETKYGWRYHFYSGELYNPRTFYNFPIQAHGSEMLRRALIDLTHAGFEVNALIHDGILVQLNKKNLRKELIKAKQILVDASRKILNEDSSTDYYCDVDFQTIRYQMVQKKDEQSKWDRIIKIIKNNNPGNYSWGTQGKTTDPRVYININI